MKFWIKQRYTPQLGMYYVACGQMSAAKAKKHEGSLYGSNVMLGYETEAEYKARLAELQAKGQKVQLT